MRDGRIACPVLTCTREMPSRSLMCAHCWGRVPKALREAIGSLKGDRRGEKVRQAIAAAQAAPEAP